MGEPLHQTSAISSAPSPALSTPLRIVVSPNPFSAEIADLELPAGGTILDLMQAAGCDKALIGHAHVFITDRAMTREAFYIPRENWARVRPKPGMHVSIRVVPGKGGGGGGKNPLRTILTIAVMAAALYVGQLEVLQFGQFSIPGFTKPLFAGQIFGSIATSLVGNAAVNALAPVQPPKLSEVSGQSFGETTSPTLTITGSSNRIAPGAPVTTVVGETRIYPMMRTDAPPYTEVAGNDQYLRQLFDLGYGPLELIEERIGTVPLAQYEGVESEFRAGHDDDTPPSLYTNTIRQDGYSLKLSAGVARMVVSRIDADEITGDLSFNGLTTFSSAGTPGNRTIEVKIEYRKAGTSDPLTLHSTESITAATTSLFIHPFRVKMPARDRYEVFFTRLTADNSSTMIRDDCTVTALRTVTYTPPKIPKGRAVKALRIKATNQLNGIVQSYNCRARRLYPIWNGAAWSAPAATKNPAWVALGILRLPRKGNAVPLADSRLDLPQWLAFAQWCDRPDQNGEPMFQVGGVIDTRGTVREVVNMILATAHAWLDRSAGGKWSVGWDGPQTSSVQMFTPRNSWGFEYERSFIDLPHALKGKFINPAKDDQQDEVVVYRDGYNEENTTQTEAIELFLCDRPSQAWRELKYRWADTMLRPARYFLNVDVEHLQVRRGKRVKVSNRIMRWGLAEGRIKSLTTDGGGNVTAITLDEKLILEAGKSYALRTRKANAAQMLATIAVQPATIETATIPLSPAIAAADAPAKGDLVGFGLDGGRETVSLIVKSMSRLDGFDVRLEMVDEAPAIHTADQGPLPAFDPQQTFAARIFNPVPPQPVIADIVSDERAMTPAPGGGWVQGIDVHLSVQSGIAVNVASIEGRFRRKGSNEVWSRASAPPFSTKIRLAPVEEGVEYEFSLIATSADRPGLVSTQTYVASHVVMGRAAPPATPTTVTLNNGMIDVPGYASPMDFKGWKVGYKLGEDRVQAGAVSAHPANETVAFPFDASNLPTGTVTIFVTALDTSGNESQPAIIVKDIVAARANIVETIDFRALGWAGAITGGSVSAGDLVANDQNPFIPADDNAPFIPASDAAAFIPTDATGSYAAMTYTATFIPDSRWLPAQLTLDRDVVGQATIEIRTDTDAPFIPADDTAPFIPADDAAPFIPAKGDFVPFPGAIEARHQEYDIRVTTAGGPTRGTIKQLKPTIDVEDVDETFLDFAVVAGGTRLPLAKTYRVGVKDVGLTLLADGGAAIAARAKIDGLAPGPLIEVLNTAGAAVAGRVNATPRGY